MSQGWAEKVCEHRASLTLSLLAWLVLLSAPAQAAKGGVGGVGGGRAFVAAAGLPPLIPAQFDITGFIQEATLDTVGSICQASDPRLAGGSLKVNNIQVIVPCNTILQMPASTLTWQEVFSLAPRDIGLPLDANGIPTQSGLALADHVKLPVTTPYNGPLPSYEVHVQGNIVNGKYIAGLIFLSQQNLNLGQGVISAIDYENGELQIATKGLHPGLARVKINDPLGRYGLSHGAPGSAAALVEPGYDSRFSIDEESPTIHASTGFPMCLPRTDPFTAADDPDCPQANRPRAPDCASLPDPFPAFAMPPAGQYCRNFMMPPAGAPCSGEGGATCPPDPTRQAPFEVGDFIDYMGTLKVDSRGAYISAHTLVAHLAIYTTPGSMPVYLAIEMELQATGAAPVANLPQEAKTRIKIEGFSTDPGALVDIYAVDVDPLSGAITDRLLGAANPSGPPVVGRFRFIPFAGAFLPPPREFRVVSRSLCGNPDQPCALSGVPSTYANGLVAGQYHAPNFEFIFPENLILGDALVPANFQDMTFLFCGSGPLTTPTGGTNGPLVGQLDPPPWDTPMPNPLVASLCPTSRRVGVALAEVVPIPGPALPPTPVPPVPVIPPAPVTPPTSVTPPVPVTPPTPVVSPVPAVAQTPVAGLLAAGALASPAPFAVNQAVAVPVDPAKPTAPVAELLSPTVSVVATPDIATPGQTVILSALASDPNSPPRALTYNWTQIGWPAVAIANAHGETASFTVPVVTTATTLSFNVAVRNAAGSSSDMALTVLVKPQAPPPSVSINAPASVFSGTRVALTGQVSNGASFLWKQNAGSVVSLNNAASLGPDFIAPPGPAVLDFSLIATNAAGTSATATRSIQVVADEVSISRVVWDNRQGKGRLLVVAGTSAIGAGAPPPAGMTMQATLWNSSLPSSAAGSASHPLAVTMALVKDVPGQEPVCGTTLPCFQLDQNSLLLDPASPAKNPLFLAPTNLIVKSSLGGRASAGKDRILLR